MAINVVPQSRDELIVLAERLMQGLSHCRDELEVPQEWLWKLHTATQALLNGEHAAYRSNVSEFAHAGASLVASSWSEEWLQPWRVWELEQEAEALLRRRVSRVIESLERRLAVDDPRWEMCGLCRPSDPDLPEPVKSLTLTALGDGVLYATWPQARRARRYRLFLLVVEGEEDYVQVGCHVGSGDILSRSIEGQPPGTRVRVKVVAANDAGHAPASPVVEIHVQ